MKKLSLYIEGELVPRKNIESISITNDLVILVVLIYKGRREKIYTDSVIRKIELKYE
jgi:hypothetical protein